MSINSTGFATEVSRMLEEQLKSKGAAIFDKWKEEKVKEFAEELDLRRDELIANMAVNVSRQFSIHGTGDQVVIQINKGDLR